MEKPSSPLCLLLWMASAAAAVYASGDVMTAAGVGVGTGTGTGTMTTTTSTTTPNKQELKAASNGKQQLPLCSRMLRHVFENATPRDEQKAGVFEEYKPEVGAQDFDEETYLWNCLEACCEKNQTQVNSCNVVLVFKAKCYHIHCVSNEACLPKALTRERENEKVQMVLVNPVGDQPHWSQLLKASTSSALSSYDASALNFWKQPRRPQFQVCSIFSICYNSISKPIAG